MANDSEKRFSSIMNKLFQTPKSTPESTPTSRGKKRAHVSSSLGSKEPFPYLEVAKKPKHLSSCAGSSDVPLCRPWDHDDLMRRLCTFKSISWFAKPKVVSAVSCARRGWINVAMDMIACESCRARLLFSTPSSWNQQQVEKVALAFSLKLENGHRSLCPWMENACDEALAEFPPTPTPALIEKFNERCLLLVCVLSLPVVSPSAIEYMRNHQVEEFLENSMVLEFGDGSSNHSEFGYVRGEHDAESAKLYYQALKLISLCGWEPRSLPYMVDLDGSNHVIKAVNKFQYGKNPSEQSTDIDDSPIGDVETQSDQGSVVLDCKLCGATIGLWTFRTVPKPLEIFRLVGSTAEGTEDDSGANDSCDQGHVANVKDASLLVSSDVNSSNRLTSLNTTIAGGPSPAKQNFKATISLPVASRTLGDWLTEGLDPDEDNDTLDETLRRALINPPTEIIVQDLLHVCGYPHLDGSKLSDEEIGTILRSSTQRVINSFEKDLQDLFGLEPGSSQIIEKNNQICDSSSSLSSQVAPCTKISLKDNTNGDIRSQYGDCIAQVDPMLPRQGTVQEECAVKEKMQSSTDYKPVAHVRASVDKALEFDPIKQHRYFCPWIASTDNSPSGWEQTLSALTRKKEFPSPLPKDFRSSSSIIKVDDPVTSVRNLFTLSAKKLRQRLTSNKTT